MDLGFIGLGKMGMNMVTRLRRHGHRVVTYDRDVVTTHRSADVGAEPAESLQHLVAALAPPRPIWLMVPAGAPTESTLQALIPLLAPGDIIIDGGNTNFHDDVRRAERLRPNGLEYVDVGTSGGIWGLEVGYCLMVGGDQAICRRLEPLFFALAPEGGYRRVGPHGAGHFVKMIHNGIEYGLMQAYAEGFHLLHESTYQLELAAIADLWGHGSVVRSWLLELAARALHADPRLDGIEGHVQDSGEGRWTIEEALERQVPVPAITAALFSRYRSRQENPFAERLLAALRHQFGGHAVNAKAQDSQTPDA